jgi:hypothetical protein
LLSNNRHSVPALEVVFAVYAKLTFVLGVVLYGVVAETVTVGEEGDPQVKVLYTALL